MLKIKIGSKGEIVIPKKIREFIGLSKNREVILEIKEKCVVIKPNQENILKRLEERANKNKQKPSKWVYGDKLYEEVFNVS